MLIGLQCPAGAIEVVPAVLVGLEAHGVAHLGSSVTGPDDYHGGQGCDDDYDDHYDGDGHPE